MTATLIKWTKRMLPLGYIVVIWLQSALFNPDSVKANPEIGQIFEMGHFILFGFLYILIIVAFMTFGKLTHRKEAAAIIISLLFALGDEFHQYYVPYRSASIGDLLKNGFGILAAWYAVRVTRSMKK